MILKGFGALVLVKKGEPFDHPILKSLEPINDKFAALCLACVHDEQLHKEIAAREKMEEELRRHKDELEDLVQARTRQLYESKASFVNTSETCGTPTKSRKSIPGVCPKPCGSSKRPMPILGNITRN